MSSTEKNSTLNFFKTIRFRLTLLYSIILFLFSAVLVIVLNLYMNSYLTSEPVFRPFNQSAFPQIFDDPIDFINRLRNEEKARIREVRLEDLRKIQELSIISLFPIAILSFTLGYLISGRFLKPIEDRPQDQNAAGTNNHIERAGGVKIDMTRQRIGE